VQFGLPYGVTNVRGQVPRAEILAIVEAAIGRGIDLFDTAPAYGESERVLGEVLAGLELRVVSKLPPIAADCIDAAEVDWCRRAVEESLARLRRSSLYGLLLHRPDDLRKPGGDRLAAFLDDLKRVGAVARIGVSAYDRAQIELASDRLPLDLVQVPVNLLDQRLLRDGTLEYLKCRNVEIHARSAFLQGALLADMELLPGHLAAYRDRFEAVAAAADGARMSRLALCLRFVLDRPAIDRVIVGVTSLQELRQIVAATSDGRPLPDGLAALACDDPRLIDPSRWPPANAA
jgi:aryl-alcohol dehydrogenase-like predicted oxidoreductase